MKRIYQISISILALVTATAFTGCGGFLGESGSTGAAMFSVDWPERSRLIPVTSNSIKVTVKNGTTVITSRVLSRPAIGGTSSASLSALPAGDLTAEAVAYPNSDGSGTPQAQATAP